MEIELFCGKKYLWEVSQAVHKKYHSWAMKSNHKNHIVFYMEKTLNQCLYQISPETLEGNHLKNISSKAKAKSIHFWSVVC